MRLSHHACSEFRGGLHTGDNSNIISARVARETFGVQRVVARLRPDARGLRTAMGIPVATDRDHRPSAQRPVQESDRQMAGSDQECRSRRRGAARRPVRHRVTDLDDHRGAGRVPDPVRRGGAAEAKTVIQASDQVHRRVSGHVAEAVAIAAMPPPADLGEEA